jgi:hypothetical protein
MGPAKWESESALLRSSFVCLSAKNNGWRESLSHGCNNSMCRRRRRSGMPRAGKAPLGDAVFALCRHNTTESRHGLDMTDDGAQQSRSVRKDAASCAAHPNLRQKVSSAKT